MFVLVLLGCLHPLILQCVAVDDTMGVTTITLPLPRHVLVNVTDDTSDPTQNHQIPAISRPKRRIGMRPGWGFKLQKEKEERELKLKREKEKLKRKKEKLRREKEDLRLTLKRAKEQMELQLKLEKEQRIEAEAKKFTFRLMITEYILEDGDCDWWPSHGCDIRFGYWNKDPAILGAIYWQPWKTVIPDKNCFRTTNAKHRPQPECAFRKRGIPGPPPVVGLPAAGKFYHVEVFETDIHGIFGWHEFQKTWTAKFTFEDGEVYDKIEDIYIGEFKVDLRKLFTRPKSKGDLKVTIPCRNLFRWHLPKHSPSKTYFKYEKKAGSPFCSNVHMKIGYEKTRI